MSSLVIVAIPAEDDYIHKISSEKIPHMTLLFLGEVSEVKKVSQILGFVKHATDQSLRRFGMDVDRRGVLGPESADVLFFSKSKWSGFEEISGLRSYLLKDDNIRMAYDSTEQFSEWIPHITLGFSDSPAKPDERDYPGINYVNFDRIAVWFAEYEGIEFPLKAYSWDEEIAMGNTKNIVDEILEHHGVKGMQWGVRRAARKERAYEKRANTSNTKVALHNATGKAMEKHLDRINNKPEYVKAANAGHLLIDNHPTTKKYMQEYTNVYIKELNNAADSMGVSPSGKRKYIVQQNDSDFLGFTVSTTDVKSTKHADTLDDFKVKFVRDAKGFIIGFELETDSLTQGVLAVGDILKHYGVKGMQWGVRRKATVGPREVIVRDSRRKIKTKGGEGHPAVSTAIRAREIGQIGKKSGLKALSDEDLNTYARRIQLEQNVARLQYQEKSRSAQFIDSFLGRQGSRLANRAAGESASFVGKRALNTATRRSIRLARLAAFA